MKEMCYFIIISSNLEILAIFGNTEHKRIILNGTSRSIAIK